MKAFSGNNLKTITKMININNKNNFTLFIFHWTYEYGNIYFLGDMWKFWKIQRTESLARVTTQCSSNFGVWWQKSALKAWIETCTAALTHDAQSFFLTYSFFFKMTFETLQSNQQNRANEKYFWNVTVLQKKSQSGMRK